jgi:hypothetical protein
VSPVSRGPLPEGRQPNDSKPKAKDADAPHAEQERVLADRYRVATFAEMLAKRLARHGLGLTGGSLAAVLSQKPASASVPRSVMTAAVRAVILASAGEVARPE